MRDRNSRWSGLAAALLVSMATSGCGMMHWLGMSDDGGPSSAPATPPASAVASDAAKPAETGDAANAHDPVSQQAQSQSDHLLAALLKRHRQQQTSTDNLLPAPAPTAAATAATAAPLAAPAHVSVKPYAGAVAQVEWLDVKQPEKPVAQPQPAAVKPAEDLIVLPSIPAPAPAAVVQPASNPIQTLPPATPKQAAAAPALAPVPAPAPTPAAAMDGSNEQRVIGQLVNDLRQQEQKPEIRAMLLSALSAMDGQARLTTDDLKPLDTAQRHRVRRFHEQVLELVSASRGEGKGDPAAIHDQLERIFGQQPIGIRKIALCRSVSGFGSYDPFESESFVAGRELPMVVYVELENFAIVDDGNQFRVRLAQEVELYTEADGLRVWSQPQEQISDSSRNRRHDFFTVQLIRLPARLGVGRYRLKIRVTDMASNSFDERTIPISIIANESSASR
ncbi:MAG: hypothetical protein IT440_12945 [Phycisphaeraceae bacterium]|nr:hypothetical protein [Phycisphaeraceae bacterium]